MIRIPQVRVVDEEGNQLGVMATPDALELAQERGFDLVEVAPMSSPPVTKLLDYGQYKYEQARKEKEAKRHQRSVEFKEVRLRVKIGKGDFDTKVRRAIGFLEEGDRVKVTVQFRGREVSHAYIGRDLLQRFADRVEDHGSVDRMPILEGRSMSMVLTSTHKFSSNPPPAEANGAKANEAKRARPPETEAAVTEPTEAKTTETTSAEVSTETATKSKKAAAPAKKAPSAAEDGSETQAATTTGG